MMFWLAANPVPLDAERVLGVILIFGALKQLPGAMCEVRELLFYRMML